MLKFNRVAYDAGRRAARRRQPWGINPFNKDTYEYTTWMQGHNSITRNTPCARSSQALSLAGEMLLAQAKAQPITWLLYESSFFGGKAKLVYRRQA